MLCAVRCVKNHLVHRLLLTGFLLLSLWSCGNEESCDLETGGNGPAREPVRTDVFVGGEGGYNTYRIPALAVSGSGTVLAFCEGRTYNSLDHGDIDLVLRRSFDRGDTWEPLQVVHDEGTNTVGNPSPVVDRDTGMILLLYTLNNLRVFVTRSLDQGATWSVPEDITVSVKPALWGWYATGPGHGIQLASGRLLVPCDHRVFIESYSHAILSDDHGVTWRLGGIAEANTDESMAVERDDGSVYLTMRNNLYPNLRAFTVSSDSGEIWAAAQPATDLVDPVCQASIVRLTTAAVEGRNRILFLNPASTKRERLTLRVSYDEAQTWPTEKVLYAGKGAYSDLAVLPGQGVAALYENGEKRLYGRITFARLSIAWIESD